MPLVLDVKDINKRYIAERRRSINEISDIHRKKVNLAMVCSISICTEASGNKRKSDGTAQMSRSTQYFYLFNENISFSLFFRLMVYF